MASVLYSSLHTTNSSVDFGTTFEEPFCVTSTPLKWSSAESPENSGLFTDVSCITTPPMTKHPLGPPPPLPKTPKPKTAITKMRIEDMAASLSMSMNNSQIRLRSMSFKRQVLELRLGRLQTRTDSIRIRDQQIKRRFTEIRRQRSKMAAMNSSGSSQDSSTSSEDESRFKRKRFASGDSLVSQSESSLGQFYRNSVTRKAKVWKGRNIPMSVSAVDLSSLNPKPESLPAVQEVAPKPDQADQPRQKVRKPPSFRLKKFIQKKFKVFV